MPRAYSLDLRQRVAAACDRHEGTKPALATRFGVSERFVYDLLAKRAQRGNLEPLAPRGGPPARLQAPQIERLSELVQQQPDATLAQLQAAGPLPVSCATLCRTLQRLDLRRKKKSLHAAEQGRPDVQEARLKWIVAMQQLGLDPSCLVFVDESGSRTDMTRRYGRSPGGARLVEAVPAGHWRVTTLVGALCLDGRTATMTRDGALDGATFLCYVEQVLAPTLRAGELVVMDRLASHKVAGVEDAIARAGAMLLLLPPYSPDLNPIEPLWSKVKTFLRQAKARTEEALFAAIGQALATITAEDAHGWFKLCGYLQTVS